MDKELLDALTTAISESKAQFTLSDIAGTVGIVVVAAIVVYKQVIEPWRKGNNKPLSAQDFIGKEETKIAVDTIMKIHEMVEDGNAVILQKDIHGQNVLLNIPRLLETMEKSVTQFVHSQLRQEGHITKMVNHQSDVLIAFAELALKDGDATDRATLKQMVNKLEDEKIVNPEGV